MTRRRVLLFSLAIVLFGLLLRLPYFLHVMQDIDEGSYAGIAAAMLDGGLPYRDGVENKFPGTFYFYAAVFAVAGPYDMLAVHLATYAWTLLAALVLGLLARRLRGDAAGLLAALFWTVFTTALYPKMLATNSEILMALPCALAALLLHAAARRDRLLLFFLAGVAAGFAPIFKQVGGVIAAAAGLFILASYLLGRGLRRGAPRAVAAAALFSAGFCLPLAALAAYFMRLGIFDDWVFWTIVYAKRYIDSGAASQSFALQALQQWGPFVLSTIVLWVLLAAWLRSLRARAAAGSGGGEGNGERAHAYHLFIVLWLAVSVLATFTGKRMFGHYFLQALPPLCLAAALAGSRLFAGPGGETPRGRAAAAWRWGVLAATVLPALGFLAVAIPFEATTESWWSPRPDFRPATSWVREHTRPGDRVFVWGWFTPLYVYSQRAPSSRFVYTHIHTGYRKGDAPDEQKRSDVTWHLIPEAWAMLEEDFARRPPELILDTSPGDYHAFGRYPMSSFPRLQRIVDAQYVHEATVAGVGIWRRRQ